MSSFLEQLENSEAILLMYLAGELPEADRAEVEQMLATDATLRAMLEEIRALQANADSALAALDAGRAFNAESSVRGAMRAITRHQLAPAPVVAVKSAVLHRTRWIGIALATAALLTLGVLAWWSQQNPAGQMTIVRNDAPSVAPLMPPFGPVAPQAEPVVATTAPASDYVDQIANNLAKSNEDTLNDEANQELVALTGVQEGSGFLSGSGSR